MTMIALRAAEARLHDSVKVRFRRTELQLALPNVNPKRWDNSIARFCLRS
jgi:hypothetical protein